MACGAAVPRGQSLRPNFVSQTAGWHLLQCCSMLMEHVRENAGRMPPSMETAVYNPNFADAKIYKSLEIRDPSDPAPSQNGGRRLSLQYFDHRYGSPLHDLAYFVTKQSIPRFAADLLPSIVADDAVGPWLTRQRLSVDSLLCKLTVNSYQPPGLSSAASPFFPWHVDIPSNGQLTAIVSLGEPAEMAMRGPPYDDDPSQHLRLRQEHGSLLVLADEARWRSQHRVDIARAASSPRFSLVFGLTNPCS